MRNLFLSFTLAFALSASAEAYVVPSLTGPVVDEVGLLNGAIKSQLENNLYSFFKTNNVQIQVFITKSLQDEPIENVAIKVFDQWKIGNEKTDKGLLFLIAPNEKKLRIEVGQGLEGDIPDAIAKRIIADVVVPYFKRNEFAVGVLQGVTSIQSHILNISTQDVTVDGAPNGQAKELGSEIESHMSGKGWLILIVIGIWLIIFLINPSLALHILFAALNSRGGSGGYGGGGRGGWSGGGGKSSGGGASGSW